MKRNLAWALPGSAFASLPMAAMAHTGNGNPSGIAHGFLHPLLGLDHILAMVAVGMLAASLGGRALWLVPSAFVAMMVAGGLLGMSGFALPYAETGIAVSVVVLGLAVAAQARLVPVAAMAMVGTFAVFHGFAHGAEMPGNVAGLDYALGFVLATSLLHLAGVAAGLATGLLGTRTARLSRRLGGGLIAVAGAGLMAGYL